MAIRAFTSQNITQLQATLALLETALQSGSIEELRVAGVVTRTAPRKEIDVQLRYNQCRYELYLRAKWALEADPAYNKCLPFDQQTGLKPETTAWHKQYRNPYTEEVRHVESYQTGVIFANQSFIP